MRNEYKWYRDNVAFSKWKKVDEEPLCNFFNFEKESCLKTLLLWLNEGGSVSNFHTEIGIFFENAECPIFRKSNCYLLELIPLNGRPETRWWWIGETQTFSQIYRRIVASFYNKWRPYFDRTKLLRVFHHQSCNLPQLSQKNTLALSWELSRIVSAFSLRNTVFESYNQYQTCCK